MKQHYIPRFILEGFVAEDPIGNRSVWVYSAERQRWDKRPTSRTASLDDFYSFIEQSGERDDQVEKLLESFETPVAALLNRDVIAKKAFQPPRPDDIFVVFCSMLIARNPTTIERTKEILVGLAKNVVEEMTASPEAFQSFRSEFMSGTGKDFPNLIEYQRLRTDFSLSATKAAGLGFSLKMSAGVRDRLGSMAVDFMFAPVAGPKFITGDLPFMVIYSESEPEQYDQVVIPLSADIAAIFNASDRPEYRYVAASPANVRAVNRGMLGVSQRFLVSAAPDVFPSELLSVWAVADHSRRIEIVKELMLRETGA